MVTSHQGSFFSGARSGSSQDGNVSVVDPFHVETSMEILEAKEESTLELTQSLSRLLVFGD